MLIRRKMLMASALAPLALGLEGNTESGSKDATPSEVLGPFYKKGAPATAKMRETNGRGIPLKVTGNVWNTKGSLVEGATVELWHADHSGNYDTQGFKFRAKLSPNDKGIYEVDTIMPGSYPDRPAQHIHYLISAPGHKTLVTQAYFATDPFFEGNPAKNYKKRNIVRNFDLVRPVMLDEKDGVIVTSIRFDIVLEKA
jgi:protocatechuate 3,4-dioxygenase beta subunit